MCASRVSIGYLDALSDISLSWHFSLALCRRGSILCCRIIKPEASISVLIDGDADCVAYLGFSFHPQPCSRGTKDSDRRGIESMDDDKPFRSKDKELWRSGGLDVGEVLMKFKDLCE